MKTYDRITKEFAYFCKAVAELPLELMFNLIEKQMEKKPKEYKKTDVIITILLTVLGIVGVAYLSMKI